MVQVDGAQGFYPATFRERGVSVPLTTPPLNGARARMTQRDGLELVVPRAFAGRGAYVVRWRSIPDFCQPGVHDTRVLERIGRLDSLMPRGVWRAAWDTAAEGFAGRPARAAALAAARAEEAARHVTNHHLLLALARQADPGSAVPRAASSAQVEMLARHALGRLARELDRSIETVAGSLGALGALLGGVGLGERVGTARLPAQLAAMQAFRQSMQAAPAETEQAAATVRLVTETADVTLACLASALADARGLAEDVASLVKAWLADPGGTASRVSRAEWLADGWGWLCHLWALAGTPAAQAVALDEVALLLPVVPTEAAGWVGFPVQTDLPPRARHKAAHAGDPSPNDAMMRNERLLALAA